MWLLIDEEVRLQQLIRQTEKLVDVISVEQHSVAGSVFEKTESYFVLAPIYPIAVWVKTMPHKPQRSIKSLSPCRSQAYVKRRAFQPAGFHRSPGLFDPQGYEKQDYHRQLKAWDN